MMHVLVRLYLHLQENGKEQTVTVVENGQEREVTVIIARNDKPKTIKVRAAGAAGSPLRSTVSDIPCRRRACAAALTRCSSD